MLFCMLYGGAAVTAMLLSLYLLLRRGNAVAAGIEPPMRLRGWASAFFGVVALGHAWWFLFFVLSGFSYRGYAACVVLDCTTMAATIFGTMLAMLQDRRRRLWPFVAVMMPVAVLGGIEAARPGTELLPLALSCTMAVYVCFTIYMAVAIRQYGRWLRDNYADLEHKEVWQSHTLLILFLLLVAFYGCTTDGPSVFLLRIADFVLFGLLLWRVETLPRLEASHPSPITYHPSPDIGRLLAKHCEATMLYLQYDLTLAQLSAVVGVNRTYLSQYFSSRQLNYNAYINGLRISHFVSLYREAAAARQPFTVQQLATDSGYRSYSTFSLAFKQRMGKSVTAWIRESTDSSKGTN